MDKKKMKTLAAVMAGIMLLSTMLALLASVFGQSEEDHEGHDHASVQIVEYI